MKLALVRQGDYPEPVRSELQQLTAAITTSYTREHDAEGRQRVIWSRWDLGADLSVVGTGADVLVPCLLPSAGNSGDLTVAPSGVVTVQTPGLYRVTGQIRWQTSAVGARAVKVAQNGTVIAQLQVDAPAFELIHQITVSAPCGVGTTLSLIVAQVSGGGALLVQTASGTFRHTWLIVERVA